MNSRELYIDTLKNLLKIDDNDQVKIDDNQKIIVNLYITLLSLNDNKYTLLNIIEEAREIKILLTKLNNLKVKIQLKRKKEEIDRFSLEIKNLYEEKQGLFNGYIDNKDELFQVIDSGDAKIITEYIDRVTKLETKKNDYMDERNDLRERILDLLFIKGYKIDNNMIMINDEDVNILVDDFVDIFNYLLNIDNYDEKYKSINSNQEHTKIIEEIIKIIKKNEYSNQDIKKVMIPMILTYLLPNLDKSVKTNNFVVENIKISDLYSMASHNDNLLEDGVRWNNIKISNEYLLSKMTEMIKRGMYYYQDDKFILELVDNKVSDFKVSIEIDKMINFLMDNIEVCMG